MIEIKDLHKSYKMGSNVLHVLKGINFKVEEGELVAIMGSSGSGKSTLLNILGMLDGADSGEYTLDSVPIKNLSETKAAQYRNKFLGFIFQSFNLINYKSALENVALPLYYQKVPRKERQEKAMKYLERVGLKPWADHLPSELSGGQKQRVAIPRHSFPVVSSKGWPLHVPWRPNPKCCWRMSQRELWTVQLPMR